MDRRGRIIWHGILFAPLWCTWPHNLLSTSVSIQFGLYVKSAWWNTRSCYRRQFYAWHFQFPTASKRTLFFFNETDFPYSSDGFMPLTGLPTWSLLDFGCGQLWKCTVKKKVCSHGWVFSHLCHCNLSYKVGFRVQRTNQWQEFFNVQVIAKCVLSSVFFLLDRTTVSIKWHKWI